MLYDVKKSIWDAWNACRLIQEYTAGQTLESYRADFMRRCTIERQFEILGEALSRVDDADPSFRDRLPEIGDVIGMRNRIIHGYDRVFDKIIWNTAGDCVPALMAKLAAWLDGNR